MAENLQKERSQLGARIQELRAARDVHDNELKVIRALIAKTRELYEDLDNEKTPILHLDSKRFHVEVNFENEALPGIRLEGSQFLKGLRLSKVHLHATFRVDRTQIEDYFDLLNCTCHCPFSAIGVRISGLVDFDETTFLGTARFDNAEFQRVASFDKSRFLGSCSFEGAKFMHVATFIGSEFGDATFNGAQFLRATSFAGATFKPFAPRFHGTTLHHDTSFAGADFDAFGHERDWRAYRTLKQKMSEVKAQEEESFFFAHEQRARRKFVQLVKPKARSWLNLHPTTIVASSLVNTWISILYDYISSYGQNIGRPLLWWSAQVAAFWCLYIWQAESVASAATWLGGADRIIERAALLSVQSSLNPFAVFVKEPLIAVKTLPLFMATLLQALVSLSLLALTLLAIRRRFHKGSE